MKLGSLFEPDPARRERRLQRVKARGKKRFIIWVGVVRWGGLMFVVTTAPTLFTETPFRLAIGLVVLKLVIWPLGGYFWGLYMWNICEKQFSGTDGEHLANRV
jgi:hypothetical protein